MRLSNRILCVDDPPVDGINARRLALERTNRRIVNFGQAIPFFGPPAAAIVQVARALAEPAPHRYTPDAGVLVLREALAGGGRAEDILVTAGANHAFMLACLTLFDEGAAVGLLSPYFLNHHMALSALGTTPIEILPGPDFRYDPAVVERCIVDAGLRGLVVVNPSNPTGKNFARKELADLAALCARHRIWLIADETYRAFAPAGRFTSIHDVSGDARTISILSMSKEFGMTGWRIGALRAPADVIRQATKAQDLSLICAPHPSQLLALTCLREHAGYATSFADVLSQRRQKTLAALAAADVETYSGEGSYFVWFRPRDRLPDERLAYTLLEEAGVCLLPGSAFGRAWTAWLRLSFGNVNDVDLAEGVQRIVDWLNRSADRTTS